MSETLENLRTETHKIMGGKVNIYRRQNSDNWQCSTFLNGRNWRITTHEDSLGRAKDFAEDWISPCAARRTQGFFQKRNSVKVLNSRRLPPNSSKKLPSSPKASEVQRG